MSDPSSDGIHLTKNYHESFSPTDLQWEVSKIDNDFTLYDLFVLIRRIDNLIPGITACFGMPEFEAFWDQINLPRDLDDRNDLEYLELYWTADYNIRTTKRKSPKQQSKICKDLDLPDDEDYWDDPKNGELSNLMGFHGIGPYCHLEHCNSDKPLDESHVCDNDDRCLKKSGYAIEFSPVNNLSHLPIHISTEVYFHQPHVESDRDFHRTGFKLTIDPTLWCFITSVLWELTFVGYTPNKVAIKLQEVLDRVDEAKAHMQQDETKIQTLLRQWSDLIKTGEKISTEKAGKEIGGLKGRIRRTTGQPVIFDSDTHTKQTEIQNSLCEELPHLTDLIRSQPEIMDGHNWVRGDFIILYFNHFRLVVEKLKRAMGDTKDG